MTQNKILSCGQNKWPMHRLLILTLLLGSMGLVALRAEEPVYEFRGVWVATVTNIDWPSQRELPVEELKKEALEIIGLRSEEHTSELQSRPHLVCRLLLEK